MAAINTTGLVVVAYLVGDTNAPNSKTTLWLNAWKSPRHRICPGLVALTKQSFCGFNAWGSMDPRPHTSIQLPNPTLYGRLSLMDTQNVFRELQMQADLHHGITEDRLNRYSKLIVDRCVQVCLRGDKTQTSCYGAAQAIREHFKHD